MQVLKGNIRVLELIYVMVSICVLSQRFDALNPFASPQPKEYS